MRWTWIIGDVHGQHDLLLRLLAAIEGHGGQAGGPGQLVFVGDLIDHGVGSADVLRTVVAMRAGHADTVVLPGNHEATLQRFLFGAKDRRPAALREWLGKGGGATLQSLGIAVPPPKALAKAATAERLREYLLGVLHPLVAHWLEYALDAVPYHDVGRRFRVVHAGFRPGVPTARQRRRDLLEIREPFLSSGELWDDRVVIHGHTRLRKPLIEVLPARINVDIGGARGRSLGAVAVDGQGVLDALVVDADGGVRTGDAAWRTAQPDGAGLLLPSASSRITAAA